MRLLTRQSWLRIGLPPTAVNLQAKMNGQQTRWTRCIDCRVWGVMLKCFLTFRPKPGTEENLAVNMKTAAAGLNQQGHTFHKKTSSLSERRDGHLERAFEKNCLTTLNITSNCPFLRCNFEIWNKIL